MCSRFLLCVAAICWGTVACGQESQSPQIVFSNPAVAALLSGCVVPAPIAFLERCRNESDDQVALRSRTLLRASCVIYDSRNESPRAAMFRERLANQGAVMIDVRRHLRLSHGNDSLALVRAVTGQIDSLFASYNK